jgi:hypothetical protein
VERTFTQVFLMKLIRFTLPHTVLIIVRISEPFVFTAFITQIFLVKIFTKFSLLVLIADLAGCTHFVT